MSKIMNVFLSALLILTIFFSSSINISAANLPKITKLDTASNWAKKEINACYANLNTLEDNDNVIPKIFNNNFKNSSNRDEFTQFAVLYYDVLRDFSLDSVPEMMEEYSKRYKENRFVDSKESYVDIAYAEGIIEGVSATKFDPYGTLTREQMCTILYRLFNKLSVQNTATNSNISFLKKYNDINKISPWALDAVKFMNSNKILLGDGTSLNPKQAVTREQAIALMYRMGIFKNKAQTISFCKQNAHAFFSKEDNFDEDEDKVAKNILFEYYDDFNNDGNIDGVILIKNKPEDDTSSKMMAFTFDDKGFISKKTDLIDCSNKYIVKAKIGKVKNYKGLKLITQTKNTPYDGFVVYNLTDNLLKADIDLSESFSGMGVANLYDKNNDGIYDGYTVTRDAYDVFYYNTVLNMDFDYSKVDFKNGSIMKNDEPMVDKFSPEIVVKQYLYLVHLRNNEFYDAKTKKYIPVPELDKAIKELCEVGADKDCVYDRILLENTSTGYLDDKINFKSKTNGNKATVTTDKNLKFTYHLKKSGEDWIIEKIVK